ncbi:MAG: hypothetical protein IMZ52_10250, partial [Actinobacteria bacterium]|nr:hypothetical protein [Actinomycetota bacterium]
MSYSINVTYHSPAWTPGRTEVIGTNSNIVNTSVSNLQSRGYVIDSIVAQGAGKNVTGPVSQVVPSAQYNKASTVIYKAGTPIGKELEQPVTPQPVTQQTVQLKRGESYIGGIIYPEVKSATGVLPIPIKGQPDTRPQQKAYGLAQQSIQLQLYFNKQQVQMIEAAPSSTVFTRQDGTQITREQALQEAKANETNLSTNLNNISSYQRQGYDISQPKPGEYSFILSSEKQQQMQLAAINAENAMYKKLGWMGELVVKGKTALGYATYGTEYLHALGLTGIVSYYDYVQNIASGNIEKKFEGIQGNITIKGHDIWKNLENKDYGAAGVKIATSPTMTDIVLPFAFAGGLSLAFKGVGLAAGAAVSEAAAGSSSIITKTAAVVLPPFLKTAPWVIGTTFTSMAGAQVGMTAAMEQKGVLAKGSTALLIQKLGVQFGSAGIGASMAWNSKVFNAKIANQKIITKTVGIRNPENPTEALFISKVKGKDIFSVVETRPIDVGLKEPITVSSGMMYYKSGSKGIAFKEQPIFGVSKGKYMGDVNEYLTTTSRGLFLGEKEIIISKGLSLSKTLYEGESIIKGGSLSQRKGTVELIESIGAFKGKTTKGIFGDITKIVTPKVEGKEYFGSDMGFAQHDLLLVTKNVSDMLLPGGIFAETTKIGYPLVMAPMYPQVTKIIEEDISYASF